MEEEHIVRKRIYPWSRPTRAQKKEHEEAAKRPIVFDEDDPEYTYEEMLEMIEAAKIKRAEEKQKKVVSLRLSKATIEKAKRVGKGYTGFLSRLVENALNDKELVAKSL